MKLMTQKKGTHTFYLNAGSSFLLLGGRFISLFVLRILVDPITVGVINTAQALAPVFSAFTFGAVYNSLRQIPSLDLQRKLKWAAASYLTNLLEAFVVLVVFLPVYHVYFSHQADTVTLIFVGLFVLSFRSFGVIESLFLSMERPEFVASNRLLRLGELALALLLVSLVGDWGYLVAAPFFCLICLVRAFGRLRLKDFDIRTAVSNIKPTAYGTTISLEKILATFAASIDSLAITFLLGPVALANYFLAVSVRSSLSVLINSLYWTLWPAAVQEQDQAGTNQLARVSSNIFFLLLVAALTLVIGLFLHFAIIVFLPQYSNDLQAILTVVSSIAPLALAEMSRAALVVEKRAKFLPYITVLKMAVFIVALLVLNLGDSELIMAVAWASFASIYIQMLAYNLYQDCDLTAGKKVMNIVPKLVLALIPAISISIALELMAAV